MLVYDTTKIVICFPMKTLLGGSEKANTLAVSHANQLSASRFDEYSDCLAEERYWNV